VSPLSLGVTHSSSPYVLLLDRAMDIALGEIYSGVFSHHGG
jgi:hypothetical protein